jgi:glycosyltransferase involved in cell wall biosynthesis
MTAPGIAPLSVLIAVPHFVPDRRGGAELIAYDTAKWLLARGHRPRVLCIDRLEKGADDEPVASVSDEHDGIPVLRLRVGVRDPDDPLALSAPHAGLSRFFRTLFARQRPDVLHVISGYLLGAPALAAAREADVFSVLTLLDFWFTCPTLHLVRGDGSLCDGPETLECARCLYDRRRRYRVPDRLSPRLMRLFMRTANTMRPFGRVIGLPEMTRSLEDRRARMSQTLGSPAVVLSRTRFLADQYASSGVIDRPIRVISPVADGRAAAKPRENHRGVRFGYLGQINPKKGVDLLIRAFNRLESAGREISLVVRGPVNAPPGYSGRLARAAAGDSRITIGGPYDRAELPGLLRGIDVLVVPSRWHENAPVVIVESFAAGVPVIGADVRGISEIVRHDVNGLLFEQGNWRDLHRQMRRFGDEPGLLARLRNGIPQVRSIDDEMQDLLAIYQESISKTAVHGAT